MAASHGLASPGTAGLHTNGVVGRGLAAHILPTSATMIGVCLTALYISLLGPSNAQGLVVDKPLAADTLVFLFSAALSFASKRRRRRRSARNEAWAEAIFEAGLALLSAVALVLAFVSN